MNPSTVGGVPQGVVSDFWCVNFALIFRFDCKVLLHFCLSWLSRQLLPQTCLSCLFSLNIFWGVILSFLWHFSPKVRLLLSSYLPFLVSPKRQDLHSIRSQSRQEFLWSGQSPPAPFPNNYRFSGSHPHSVPQFLKLQNSTDHFSHLESQFAYRRIFPRLK